MNATDLAKHDTVRAWLKVAERDLRQVQNNLDGPKPTLHGASYHCQQAVEKLVKALLSAHDIRPPKWHDIAKLVKLLPDTEELKDRLFAYVEVTVYATSGRYPDEDGEDDDALSEDQLRFWLAELVEITAKIQTGLQTKHL